MITNAIVLLIGFPGTGKLTTARQLAPLIGAKVVDGHWINNPIFGLIDPDGIKPLPASVWDRTNEVRHAVMETIATLAQPAASFIFTYYAVEGCTYDKNSYDLMLETANRRNAVFVPVRLVCSMDELKQRIVNPDRRKNLKDINPASVERYSRQVLLDPGHPNQMTLDVSIKPAAENASLIAEHIRNLIAK